jgi:hypothetical protein
MVSSEMRVEAEFLDEIQKKVFLLAINRHLYSFALRFLFLQNHATSYSFTEFTLIRRREKKRCLQLYIKPMAVRT